MPWQHAMWGGRTRGKFTVRCRMFTILGPAAEEIVAGGRRLERTVRAHTPRVLAVLGVGAYRTAFARRRAAIGPQDHFIGTTQVWVLPNPSGLNANYQLDALAALFSDLRAAVTD